MPFSQHVRITKPDNNRRVHGFEIFERDHIDRLLRDPHVKQIAYVIDHSAGVVAEGYVLLHHPATRPTLRYRHPGVSFSAVGSTPWWKLVSRLSSSWPVPVKIRNPVISP